MKGLEQKRVQRRTGAKVQSPNFRGLKSEICCYVNISLEEELRLCFITAPGFGCFFFFSCIPLFL